MIATGRCRPLEGDALPGGRPDFPASSGYDPIVETVLRAVLASQLRPGERLPERWIVEACGCTQSAAREAIGRLQTLGAVVVPERRGASVTSRREAPPDEVDRVWRQLLPLFEASAGRLTLADDSDPWMRLMAEQRAIESARGRAGDRLTELLKRVSLQRAILGFAS